MNIISKSGSVIRQEIKFINLKYLLYENEYFFDFTPTKVNYDKNYLKNLISDVKSDYYTADGIAKIFKIGAHGGTPQQQKQQILSNIQWLCTQMGKGEK